MAADPHPQHPEDHEHPPGAHPGLEILALLVLLVLVTLGVLYADYR